MHIKLPIFAALAAFTSLSSPCVAQIADEPGTTEVIPEQGRWITLGTSAGPVPSQVRSQPANLLRIEGDNYLVDAGDGVSGQLAKAGLMTAEVDGVFISHLHFDHIAGLSGLLGLRWQTNATQPLRIWGPPGTKATVDGIVASMIPGTTAGYGIPGAVRVDPRDTVEVIEIRDGADLHVGGIRVRVRSNTHYSFEPGSDLAKQFEALSYRFDLPGRSILYTGDTGPSENVNTLAQGVDLLVAEMMDVENTVAAMRRTQHNVPEQVLSNMEKHLRDHHLLPADVGRMAAAADAGAVVITHFMGRERDDPGRLNYLAEIAEYYAGPAVIAEDMDAY
ncbi:MBL fold metallo-hydrolase [Novosphingobium profundi]|uniref:MBL fold metallo-hydrolase n=1 Tax=Novosphingobium profundi TaxID=1774954 RepID=UPI001CFE4082|nr:MBL fold metallo-hydrolase [Novosphingobium profundi]